MLGHAEQVDGAVEHLNDDARLLAKVGGLQTRTFDDQIAEIEEGQRVAGRTTKRRLELDRGESEEPRGGSAIGDVHGLDGEAECLEPVDEIGLLENGLQRLDVSDGDEKRVGTVLLVVAVERG